MAIVPTRSSADPNSSADINTLQAQISAFSGGPGGVWITIDGSAYTSTKIAGVVIDDDYTIGQVRVYVDTAPVGADLQIDVDKNGTTVFTTQANRPIVADGTNSDVSGTPDVTTITAGDRLTVAIDQVGSTTPGGNFIYIFIPLT